MLSTTPDSRRASPARPAALAATRLPDSPPEPAYDRLTRLAAALLRAPVALVSFVDGDRQFCMSVAGLPAGVAGQRETPLAHSFCGHVVTSGAVLAINDARTHPLVGYDPAAAAFDVTAYLGAPLTTAGGHAVGTLCVLDTVPRAWSDADVAALTDLAAAVMTEIKLRGALAAERATLELLRAVTEGTTDAVYVKDAEGRYAMINSAGATLLGRTPDEVVGRTDSELFDAGAAARIVVSDRAVLASGAPRTYEETASARGVARTYFTTKSVLRDHAGTARGVVGISRDISERRRAETALQASEERYRSLAASSPVGVFEADLQGHTTYANRRCSAIWHATETEVLSHGWMARVHPDDLPEVVASYQAALAAGLEFDRRFRLRLPDGTVRWLHGRSAPRRNAVGALVGVVGTVEDVTTRVEADEALRRQALAVATMSEAVIFTDADGRITDWNPAAERLFGYPRAAALGRTGEFLWSAESAAVLDLAEMLATMEREGRWAGEIAVCHAGGERRLMEVVITPVRDATGAVAGTVAVNRDVTEARSLEARLRQAQKMEAVGRLAGGIAHDFNNVLTAIRSYSDFLLDDLDESDVRRADVGEISSACSRAATLVRQLLAFSRQQLLQPRALDVNTTVRDLAPMLGRLLGANVQLDTSLRAELGTVYADPGQVEQVLLNLVVNARDAMPDGGGLIVETASVELDADHADGHGGAVPGSYVMLAVSDSGVGMDRETQARIFEPFYTTKSIGQGTGLGLATVYGIVKQSGGYIWVYSEPGHGTTFKIYLPRVDAQIDDEPAAADRAGEPGTGTVLLVEEDDTVRAAAHRALARAGDSLPEAPNGGEALALRAVAGAASGGMQPT